VVQGLLKISRQRVVDGHNSFLADNSDAPGLISVATRCVCFLRGSLIFPLTANLRDRAALRIQ
jgi:hypothetical protein